MLDRKTYRTKDYYSKFQYGGKNYFKNMGKNEASRKVDSKLFIKIIRTYLKIYFYELYLLNKPMYFLFGGLLRLCRIGNKVVTVKGKKQHWKHSLGLFWYNRPSQRFLFSMSLKKLNGSNPHNALPKLEKIWKEENEITELPIFLHLKNKHFDNKTYFQEQ